MNGTTRTNGGKRTGLSALDVIVTIVILVALVALLIPATQRSCHPASARSRYKNNLKQIGLALHNYHDVHNTLPPGITVSEASSDVTGNHFGWVVHILPFSDQAPLFRKFDSHAHLSQTGEESNSELAATLLSTLRCPSDEGPAPIRINRTIALKDGEPAEVPMTSDVQNKTTVGFSSWHEGGCQVLPGDGTVRFLSEDIDPVVFQSLARRSDAQAIGEF